MNTELYNILENLVNIGISEKIFLSRLIKKNGKQYPVFAVGNEYNYIGIDENKCRLGYVRQLEETQFTELNLGGCGKSYKQIESYRLVIFDKSFEGNIDFFVRLLKGNLLNKNINLKRVWINSSSLLNTEQFFDNEIELMPNNLYLAIDFIMTVLPLCCPPIDEHCKVFNNIICKL